MLFFSRERHCGGGVQACRHKMTEKPITDIASVAAFGGEFSSYPWMPQSKSVCEELHAASASRMSLCWLVFRQASEAFSSSSRAMRLAVTLLEISNVLHTENQRCCIILYCAFPDI